MLGTLALQAQRAGNGSGEFDKTIVEKRHARFQRDRHTHTIHFYQNVIHQICGDVHVLLLIQRIGGGECMEFVFDEIVRIMAVELRTKVIGIEPFLFGLLQKDHPAHVLQVGRKLAAFDKAFGFVGQPFFLIRRRQQIDRRLDESFSQKARKFGIALGHPLGQISIVPG